ncbi:unnamed protein product [Rangifer tarandus platyrhynchus]|uniref:Secreted protein n=2 Tax=Rangifer tarandus platyrhynchus TaxID=3082113 RepID=A0ABN8Y5B9_RANTA|nr:unnamed protein product [Rangifer tarandus platyrhynchus]
MHLLLGFNFLVYVDDFYVTTEAIILHNRPSQSLVTCKQNSYIILLVVRLQAAGHLGLASGLSGLRLPLCVLAFSLMESYSGHVLPVADHRSPFEAPALIMSVHIFWTVRFTWSSPKSTW